MKIVNIQDDKCDEYIGRGSVLGNPFIIGKDGDREEVIRKYKNYIWNCLRVVKELERLASIDHKYVLGCHCKPKACHGDVIIKAVEYLNREEKS